MHVTARVDYALQAMLILAHDEIAPIPTSELADTLGVSYGYLHTVVNELRRARLVRGLRGPQGGLRLARPASDITLDQIVWAIDGPLTTADGTQLDSARRATGTGYLPSLWFAAHKAMLEVFAQIRLNDATVQHLPPAVRDSLLTTSTS